MPLPTRQGLYFGRITSSTIETNKNGNIAFIADIALDEWYGENDEQWYDISHENSVIRCWMYLLKNDGSPNDISVQQIRNALDWNGDIRSLAGVDAFKGSQVQLLAQQEEYQGKVNMKVKGIRKSDTDPTAPWGSSTLKAAEPSLIDQLAAQHNGKFKALMGEPSGPPVRRGGPPTTPQQPAAAPSQPGQQRPASSQGGAPSQEDLAKVDELQDILARCVKAANAPPGTSEDTIEYWCIEYSSFDGNPGVNRPSHFLSASADPVRHNAAMALLDRTIARARESLECSGLDGAAQAQAPAGKQPF